MGKIHLNVTIVVNIFSEKHIVLYHKKYREISFKFNLCDKSYAENSHLVKYQRTHTGEKPFKCDRCEKSFAHKIIIICHQRIYNGETSFKCDQCGKNYAKK